MIRAARTRLTARERELQILQAATRVFARSNYRLTRTADIALEAGISEPTIYKYFPSKKDLFIRILKRIGERILEIWSAVAASEEGNSLSALRRMGHIYVEILRTHRDEIKVQFQALAESDDPDIARQMRENNKAYVRFLAQIIDRGKSDGIVRGDIDPYVGAWLINSIVFTLTLVRLLYFDQDVGERRVVELIVGYLDWLTSGRRVWPTQSVIRVVGTPAGY
ncbi:MAG: TetR/AcrR family transcriptional regulator [Dehalococcoidia bacterium]